MRFFTPELYTQFNSANDEEADRADEAWEKAIHAYGLHLEKLRVEMPPRLKELADQCCFHDAELLSFREEESEPLAFRFPAFFPFLPIAILTLRQRENLILVIYLLWNKIRQSPPREGLPFSSHKRHWLYDELDGDARGPGIYWHRILLSDGTVFEIPLFDVFIQTLEIPMSKTTTLQSVRA